MEPILKKLIEEIGQARVEHRGKDPQTMKRVLQLMNEMEETRHEEVRSAGNHAQSVGPFQKA